MVKARLEQYLCESMEMSLVYTHSHKPEDTHTGVGGWLRDMFIRAQKYPQHVLAGRTTKIMWVV